ncbi:similar to Saccharomyces cerevisiae YKR061W KTR2 Mannosyltransferase involved in N-linked protein glycosylation [Maudiozyma saulgeensis]|uniref:Similar to Saccharomyces cerevisiae YKR061W KTR2 Mannosyltransferase involved in N-linked protein glycosylation n=1 Tax=Maudiozyma saulgeensis TaxID=1789683 RepID=A0A1X7RAZ3_9SACH|nr:similar to Saccharomyces cerevisiae YKR061W KTR2 Mannosyltransferase involved in N-linked protein glycosylation [Kazachstania saulgeensis]
MTMAVFLLKWGLFIVMCIPMFLQLKVTLEGLYVQTILTHHYKSQSRQLAHKYDSSRMKVDHLNVKLGTNTYDPDPFSQIHKGNISGQEHPQKENATLLMLVRNEELEGALESMRSLEDRFNKDYQYDWTFLNDVPFTPGFILATTAMASGKTQYGLIPSEDWDRPDWIEDNKFTKCMNKMKEDDVMYGDSVSYRNMCRFNSGYFFRQELLMDYDYYFRVEPNVGYFCDLPYDPFKVLRERKAKYGFVISLYEYENTIPTLWDAVSEYIVEDNGRDVQMDRNYYGFITDKSQVGRFLPAVESNSDYNLCHFWSNFEVGDLNFFRSEQYLNYFNHLDSKGGFYYERWGDAPVHSIGASLLLKDEEIIHFDQISYCHPPFYSCPTAMYGRLDQRCICDSENEFSIDIRPHSCLMRWWKNGSGKHFIKEG